MRKLARGFAVAAALFALYGFGTYRQMFVTGPARRAMLALNGAEGERFACLYGLRAANTVVVLRAAPAPKARRQANLWATEVVCEPAPWLLGTAHNHPLAVNCWYRMPGTDVPTSDLVTLRNGTYAVGVIVCGETFVWELNN